MAENGDVFAIAQRVTHIQDNTPESILISSFHSWPQPLGHSIPFLSNAIPSTSAIEEEGSKRWGR